MPRLSLPSAEAYGESTGAPEVFDTSRRFRRAFVFAVTLLVAAVAGLVWNFSRPPVYRATATVQTVKPKAIDRPSIAADLEHVAIQERTLLGPELLGRVEARLSETGVKPALTAPRLAAMLSVRPVADTNLVELVAEGAEPERVQAVVNAWADGYQALRREQIARVRQETLAEVQTEYDALEARVAAKTDELARFRETHDIVSLRDADNRPAAKLKGLNAALNSAQERLVEAEARRDAVQAALARGETVVPRDQRGELASKAAEVARLRNRLEELRVKYTDKFIENDPNLRDLPGELERAEQELAALKRIGRSQIAEEIDQDVNAARAAVARANAELDAHQRDAAEFAETFERHEALTEELADLRELTAARRDRIAEIEARNYEKYPPVDVVQEAERPRRPVGPPYWRDAALVVAAALTLALFVTWLLEYLFGRQRAMAAGRTEIRMVAAGPAAREAIEYERTPAVTEPQGGGLLPATMLNELTVDQVRRVMDAADPLTRAYLGLLLAGLAPEELAGLGSASLDVERGVLTVDEPRRREVTLPPGVMALIAASDDGAAAPRAVAAEELDASLTAAALDAGLEDAAAVDAAALRATYLIYLVRQGVRLSELPRHVGGLGNAWLVELARFSPGGAPRPLAEVDVVYPFFAGSADGLAAPG